MELPIVEFSSYAEEMSTDLTHLFNQERQFTQFKRLIKELLQKTQAGCHISKVAEVKREIKDAYNQYLVNGYVPYNGIDIEVDRYSHKEMAKKFARILNDVI